MDRKAHMNHSSLKMHLNCLPQIRRGIVVNISFLKVNHQLQAECLLKIHIRQHLVNTGPDINT